MSDDHDKHEEGKGHASHGGGGHAAHGGGSHEEHEGAPEWLISFADNVALMMGFFVILLAMNMGRPEHGGPGGNEKNPADTQKEAMLDFVLSMREAFNNPVDMEGANPNEAKLRKRKKEQEGKSETNDPGPEGQNHSVQAIETSDYVAPVGIIPFDVQSATVSNSGSQAILDVAEQIRGRRVFIEVRGHVSAVEAMKDPELGMRLSHTRSLAVAHLLVEHGVKWNQIRLVSCATSSPVRARADTPMEHRTNQRVEIVLTKEPLPPDQFNAESGKSSGGVDEKP